jgi:hypothetical protein
LKRSNHNIRDNPLIGRIYEKWWKYLTIDVTRNRGSGELRNYLDEQDGDIGLRVCGEKRVSDMSLMESKFIEPLS